MNIPNGLNNNANTSVSSSPYTGKPTNSVLGISSHFHNSDSSHGLVKLNIGGRIYTTTKQTLLSKGENFFSPLISGDFPSVKDDNGKLDGGGVIYLIFNKIEIRSRHHD